MSEYYKYPDIMSANKTVKQKEKYMHPLCCCQIEEINEAEKIISESIESCYPREWDENHITYKWLENFRNNFKRLYFPQQRNLLRVDWDAYKMSGKLEQDNGDIAFVVKLYFENGNFITGVGFLEAKRINNLGSRYDSLKKWNQLIKMSANFSSHQLLLYNFEKQPTMLSSSSHEGLFLLACDCCEQNCLQQIESNKKTNAISVPSAHALHYEDKSKKLSNIGYPLSEQVLHRYFYGLDLQFDKDIVNDVITGAKGGIDYLVMAKVLVNDSTEINISDELFEPNEKSGFVVLKESNEGKRET